jgi:hypothetical protein
MRLYFRPEISPFVIGAISANAYENTAKILMEFYRKLHLCNAAGMRLHGS